MYRDGVRPESTGWRDERISQRHRRWGYDCPGVDLDFVLLEFATGQPVALIEYKTFGVMLPILTSPTYTALRALADNSQIPFMVVFYNAMAWWFRVLPANECARRVFPQTVVLSEFEYVEALYRMRGLTLPPEVALHLNTEKPVYGVRR